MMKNLSRLLLIAGLASASVLMVGHRAALAQDDAGSATQAPSGDNGDNGDDSGQPAPENPQ
jgi:hypothetical protein